MTNPFDITDVNSVVLCLGSSRGIYIEICGGSFGVRKGDGKNHITLNLADVTQLLHA